MMAYVAKRLLWMLPTLFGIIALTFALMHLVPGDPVALKLAQQDGSMRTSVAVSKVIEQTRAMYGLDQPLPVQFGRWVWRVVRLDFGASLLDERPVLAKIGEALPLTILLNILSLLATYLLAIPLGIWTAVRAGEWPDRVSGVLLYILYALPSFWVASLLLTFFAVGDYYQWFPLLGAWSDGVDQLSWLGRVGNVAWHLVLPVFCLTYGGLAFLSRFARNTVLDVLRQDFLRTARAKGVPEWRVIWRHGVRNALLPFVTLMGTLLPSLLGGSVIIEQMFNLPGMGRLGFEAVLARDYPMIMGIAVISAALTLVSLLISDLLYAAADPRIRLDGGATS